METKDLTIIELLESLPDYSDLRIHKYSDGIRFIHKGKLFLSVEDLIKHLGIEQKTQI